MALSAITANSVVELDDDVASRWGPRTTEMLTAIVNAVNKLTAAQ
jgi:iron complex transport system substrate-binding protein